MCVIWYVIPNYLDNTFWKRHLSSLERFMPVHISCIRAGSYNSLWSHEERWPPLKSNYAVLAQLNWMDHPLAMPTNYRGI